MWTDNESEIDLLGFEYLVDSLEIILTDEALLPVTVGVTGDWGSGKSSLMKMAQTRLDSKDDSAFVTATFSPWRFEGYEDVKAALIETVLNAIGGLIENDEELKKTLGVRLRELRAKVSRWRLLGAVAQGGALLAGASPAEAAAAATAAQALEGAVADTEGASEPAIKPPSAFETISGFHAEFEQLIAGLGDDFKALVVFVDDVDRCSAEAIVDTFEAIRLFLHSPKTAYVVGANEQIVESALRSSLPAQAHNDDLLGKSYLEKMLQMSVVVPPLAEPEVLTYISLLFAERDGTQEQFEELLSVAEENRQSHQLRVAMNVGIAKEKLGEGHEDLLDGMGLATHIAPSLARGLRGNPRQIKRFLNTFSVRLLAAKKRNAELSPGVLAKLMLLEFVWTKDFEQLFQWQLGSDGPIPQIAGAEKLARSEKVDATDEVKTWALQPGVTQWLLVDPSLADTDLLPYLTFTRDRLSKSVLHSQLPAALQQLVASLQSTLEPTRAAAVKQLTEIGQSEFADVYPAILEVSGSDPKSKAMVSAVEVASKRPEAAGALFSLLDSLDPGHVTPALALKLQLVLGSHDRLPGLFERWKTDGPSALKNAVEQAQQG